MRSDACCMRVRWPRCIGGIGAHDSREPGARTQPRQQVARGGAHTRTRARRARAVYHLSG